MLKPKYKSNPIMFSVNLDLEWVNFDLFSMYDSIKNIKNHEILLTLLVFYSKGSVFVPQH